MLHLFKPPKSAKTLPFYVGPFVQRSIFEPTLGDFDVSSSEATQRSFFATLRLVERADSLTVSSVFLQLEVSLKSGVGRFPLSSDALAA